MGDIDFKDTLAFNRCQSFYSLSVWCLDQTSARSLGATTDDVLSHSRTLNTFVFHLSLAQLHWLVFPCTSVFSRSASTNCQWPFACTAMNVTDVAIYIVGTVSVGYVCLTAGCLYVKPKLQFVVKHIKLDSFVLKCYTSSLIDGRALKLNYNKRTRARTCIHVLITPT